MTWRRVFLLILLGMAAFAVVVGVLFRADMRAARAALDAYETVAAATSVGPVETVDAGDGFPVLSIHGTGGGYDQGYALAAGLHDAGYRIIAPSRFGYLGAPVPDATDARTQADVLAELLDARGVPRREACRSARSASRAAAAAAAASRPSRCSSSIFALDLPSCRYSSWLKMC